MIDVHIDSVTWNVTVRLPQWTPPPADQAAWNNLINQLEGHEQGHVNRYNNGMPAVRTALVCTTIQVPMDFTDAQIDSAAKAAGRATPAWQAMEQSNANYDAPFDATTNPTGTNHGTENGQSASWPQ